VRGTSDVDVRVRLGVQRVQTAFERRVDVLVARALHVRSRLRQRYRYVGFRRCVRGGGRRGGGGGSYQSGHPHG